MHAYVVALCVYIHIYACLKQARVIKYLWCCRYMDVWTIWCGRWELIPGLLQDWVLLLTAEPRFPYQDILRNISLLLISPLPEVCHVSCWQWTLSIVIHKFSSNNSTPIILQLVIEAQTNIVSSYSIPRPALQCSGTWSGIKQCWAA